MRHTEHLNTAEARKNHGPITGSLGTQLSHEQAEEVMLVRQKMLFSLKGDIDITLFDALDKKLQYERVSLQQLVEADTEVREIHRKLNKVLRSEYFVQRPLDINTL